MAGLLYLPRLFVYHSEAKKNSDKALTFVVMEKRLLKIIMNPAMVITLISGISLGIIWKSLGDNYWWYCKLLFVFGLMFVHMLLAKWRKEFEVGDYPQNARFFRYFNELPTIFMVAIIVLVVVKPF